jgi:ATP-binding cassette subfamily D (ALD) long-chain fatty acid import protein
MPAVFSKPGSIQELTAQFLRGLSDPRARRVIYIAIVAILGIRIQRSHQAAKRRREQRENDIAAGRVSRISSPSKKSTRAEVDIIFLERLQYLLRIIIPGIKSKEFWMLMLHSAFLGK